MVEAVGHLSHDDSGSGGCSAASIMVKVRDGLGFAGKG
jgi:hypothetical protein